MRLELTNNSNCAVAKLDGELDEGCVREVREKIDKFIANNNFGQFVFDFYAHVLYQHIIILFSRANDIYRPNRFLLYPP